MTLTHAVSVLILLLTSLHAPNAYAQTASTGSGQAYPTKSVRVIVASGAGSGDDFYGSLISIKLGELLGQQFIVDNRAGAGGLIGHQLAIKSPADGYTLMLGGGSMAGARFVNANVNYDVTRDLTPVSLIETSPFVLLVHPSLPVRNVKAFIALARSRPGTITTANLGVGQMPYWCNALLRTMARIETVDVPYKTGPAAIVDLIAGQVDAYFAPSVNAISSRNKLHVLAMPDVRERILKAGSEPAPGSPEQLAKQIADSVERFGRIAKLAGIKPQ